MTVGEDPKEILIDAPSVENIATVLIVQNASNETQSLNASQIPVTVVNPDSEAIPESSELLTEDTKTNDSIVEKASLNITVEENQIPVFSEWAQKRMEEVEKEDEQDVVNSSSMKKNTPSTNKPQVTKLKGAKNYASPDCGAKIIAANSESSGTGYVLTSTKDEYMLSPCKSRIWFVVELCEAIQAERIDLANFELFSSSPKNFSVAVSSRFPTRDWSNVGKFIAKDERYIQNFDLYPHLFGKYVRVDVHSHYNSEHFCPISLFRVYGTSEFEAFETENRQHPIEDMDVDDEDDQETETNKSKSNIFQSASDAVMSIVDTVKKAASFVKPNGNKTISNADNSSNAQHKNCITPNYAINCENCPDKMTSEVNAISQCKQQLLQRLLNIEIVKNSLYKSHICANLIGSDLNINCSETSNDNNATTSKQLTDLQMEYITHLFSLKYITAMCNLLAANDRKFVWNSTIPLNTEPLNITIDKNAGALLPKAETKTETPTIDSIQSAKDNEEPERKVIDMEQPIEEIPAENDHISNENIGNSEEIENIESKNIPSSSGEGSESNEKLDQNIFNVVQPTEVIPDATDPPQIEITSTETTSNKPAEPAQPPHVIILPESTTTTTTPNPTEINDVTDDQAANGWTNTQQFGQKLHSESVFLRLSNRVKVSCQITIFAQNFIF